MKLSPGPCPWAALCHTGSEQGQRKAHSRRTGAQELQMCSLSCKREAESDTVILMDINI